MSVWPDWLKVIQLKARYLFGIWLLGVIILLLPSWLADMLRITGIRDTIGGWVGLVALGAFAFWLVQLWPWLRRRWW